MAKKKKAQAETIECPKCGEASPSDSEKCEHCGEAMRGDGNEPPAAGTEANDEGAEGALDELMSLPGVKKAKAELLHEAGFRSLADIREAKADQLASIKGIGQALAERLIQSAKEMAAPGGDRNLADWLSGEDDGLAAWLSGEERMEAPPAEAAAVPEMKHDASLAKWLAGEEESIDSWLDETAELAKPEKPVSKKDLRSREAEVSQLRDMLIEKIKQIESGDFDPKAIVEEIAGIKSELEAERGKASRLEEELENVKRGSIAVIKFIKKQQETGITGENLADKLAGEMAAKETLQQKVGELESLVKSLREKAESGISELPPDEKDLRRREMEVSSREAQLAAMERQMKAKEQSFADALIDYASPPPTTSVDGGLLSERDEEFAAKERLMREKIEKLEADLSQATIDLKHMEETMKMSKGTSGDVEKEAMQKLQDAQRMERNLVLREQEVARLKEDLRIREEEMARLKEPLAYKEDELIRREEDLMYREKLLQEENRKLSQMQAEVGSQDEITLKRRLEELQGQVNAKEEEIRNKEKFLHVKEEELRIREQGLIDEEIERRELDRMAEIKLEKVKTGTSRLDDLLLGGIPFGTNVLVYGPPFTGKEVLVNSFVGEGLKMGIPAIWVITEKSPKEIREEMMFVLSGYEEYEKKGLVRYVDSYSRGMGDDSQDEYTDFVESPTDYEAIQKAVEEAAKTFKESHQYYRLAFRSISTMIAYLDPNTAFRFLSPIAGRRKRDRAVSMYTIEKGVHGEQEIQMLGSLMDGMIEFKLENLNTFLAIRGISDVQSRAFIRYSATKQGVNIGSFSLDHIR
jgi:KaiC/GvpD/RAD55 family RecA-like ATPase